MYLVPATANLPLPKIGQGMIQGGLQRMVFHLNDMHTVALKIKGDIEFQKELNVK
jgi:hypothetical protein